MLTPLRALAAALALSSCLAAPLAGVALAKAVYGEWGVVQSDQDTTVKPGDDFYMYVNGGWDKRVQIPADRATYSDGTDIEAQAESDLHEIAENAKAAAPGTTLRKVGDYYASFMDTAAIEAQGLAPLKPQLDETAAIASPADLARAFARTVYGFGTSPIAVYLDTDSKQPGNYAAYFTQSGLGLPDRDYYLKDTDENLKYRAAYQAYIEKLLGLAGVPDGAAKAKAILALETEIAKLHWAAEDARETLTTYNPVTPDELAKQAPGIDWAAFLETADLTHAPRLVLAENTAIVKLSALTAATPMETWKAYLTFHTLNQAAPYLPKAFDDAQFDFNGKTMEGQEVQRERWKRALDLIDGTMGEAMGEAYVAKRFTPEAKAEMARMVANLKTALGQMIDEAAWMDPSTKKAAHRKLDAMQVMIGYPDTWRDYTRLEIKEGDLLGNVARAYAFDWTRQTTRIADPVDKAEWGMTPPTVNAYNSFNNNQIVFPAGILQPPYFDLGADMAVNYGATGATIGHEISHGFDDQGRKYDETGAIRDGWTAKDAAAYDAEAKKLIAQFNAYEPLPGIHVNGALTQGENIADLAGLAIAYRAYKLALNGKEAPVIDGLTGDQRFFLGYAMSWRSKRREDSLRARLASDPHAPAYYRVNGIVNNFQPWYDAFGIGPDAKLYVAPEKRARLW
ncbi:MAG: M13 family metallopeptidase [Alphaproteobacteria bacterium]|nr:M13 family metallopeptidase [Alphaproteobacteria bacterium]